MLPELTSLNATFISHKRGQRQIHPSRSLLRIDGVKSRKTASILLGNAVVSEYEKEGVKYTNKGKITKVHGNSGVVQAKFVKNLPPQMIGKTVLVKLYEAEDI